MCGENQTGVLNAAKQAGSSPHVRGKPGLDEGRREGAGLIPARAGKTEMSLMEPKGDTAHPRACGENRIMGIPRTRVAGSSPRVRGKPPDPRRPSGRRGLIPARAGKTSTRPPPRGASWAHPRACGENLTGMMTHWPDSGSSPRVRGKPYAQRLRGLALGLIPACAGKTPRAAPMFANAPAHPRVCGENLTPVIEALVPVGSSPRVRGKRSRTGQSSRRPGLIPARAGKTRWHIYWNI